MGPFAETALWQAARLVLPSDEAADFCAALDAHWGFYHRAAQHRQVWQALRDQLPLISIPAGPEGVISVPLRGPAARPFLNAAAVLYRFSQMTNKTPVAGKHPPAAETTWATLTRKEQSAAWKLAHRLFSSGKGARSDVARRRLLIRWIDNQVRVLGGRLTYWTGNPLRSRGVSLVVEVFRFLGLGDEDTRDFIVKELKKRRFPGYKKFGDPSKTVLPSEDNRTKILTRFLGYMGGLNFLKLQFVKVCDLQNGGARQRISQIQALSRRYR
jgi:hypothetical protein